MNNKKILLIGYSGGIGYKTTQILLSEGYIVFGTYHNQSDKDDHLDKNFSKFQLDLTSPESILRLFDSLKDDQFYAVINCAGIVKYEGASVEEDLKIWNETIAVNMTSNFYLAKIFVDNILGGGRFIMISSTDGYFGGSDTVSYAASKAGVNSLTKSLSLTFKDKKIRVNTVAPGWVSTPMIEGSSPEFYQKLADLNPLGKIADSEDIAKVIKFLLSQDADYINGQVITVDGGYTNQEPTILIEEDNS